MFTKPLDLGLARFRFRALSFHNLRSEPRELGDAVDQFLILGVGQVQWIVVWECHPSARAAWPSGPSLRRPLTPTFTRARFARRVERIVRLVRAIASAPLAHLYVQLHHRRPQPSTQTAVIHKNGPPMSRKKAPSAMRRPMVKRVSDAATASIRRIPTMKNGAAVSSRASAAAGSPQLAALTSPTVPAWNANHMQTANDMQLSAPSSSEYRDDSLITETPPGQPNGWPLSCGRE